MGLGIAKNNKPDVPGALRQLFQQLRDQDLSALCLVGDAQRQDGDCAVEGGVGKKVGLLNADG